MESSWGSTSSVLKWLRVVAHALPGTSLATDAYLSRNTHTTNVHVFIAMVHSATSTNSFYLPPQRVCCPALLYGTLPQCQSP